jgi:hypothetical protein
MAMYIDPKINEGVRAAGGKLYIYKNGTKSELCPVYYVADLNPNFTFPNPIDIDAYGINSTPVFWDEKQFPNAYYIIRDSRDAIIREGFLVPTSWNVGGGIAPAPGINSKTGEGDPYWGYELVDDLSKANPVVNTDGNIDLCRPVFHSQKQAVFYGVLISKLHGINADGNYVAQSANEDYAWVYREKYVPMEYVRQNGMPPAGYGILLDDCRIETNAMYNLTGRQVRIGSKIGFYGGEVYVDGNMIEFINDRKQDSLNQTLYSSRINPDSTGGTLVISLATADENVYSAAEWTAGGKLFLSGKVNRLNVDFSIASITGTSLHARTITGNDNSLPNIANLSAEEIYSNVINDSYFSGFLAIAKTANIIVNSDKNLSLANQTEPLTVTSNFDSVNGAQLTLSGLPNNISFRFSGECLKRAIRISDGNSFPGNVDSWEKFYLEVGDSPIPWTDKYYFGLLNLRKCSIFGESYALTAINSKYVDITGGNIKIIKAGTVTQCNVFLPNNGIAEITECKDSSVHGSASNGYTILYNSNFENCSFYTDNSNYWLIKTKISKSGIFDCNIFVTSKDQLEKNNFHKGKIEILCFDPAHWKPLGKWCQSDNGFKSCNVYYLKDMNIAGNTAGGKECTFTMKMNLGLNRTAASGTSSTILCGNYCIFATENDIKANFGFKWDYASKFPSVIGNIRNDNEEYIGVGAEFSGWNNDGWTGERSIINQDLTAASIGRIVAMNGGNPYISMTVDEGIFVNNTDNPVTIRTDYVITGINSETANSKGLQWSADAQWVTLQTASIEYRDNVFQSSTDNGLLNYGGLDRGFWWSNNLNTWKQASTLPSALGLVANFPLPGDNIMDLVDANGLNNLVNFVYDTWSETLEPGQQESISWSTNNLCGYYFGDHFTLVDANGCFLIARPNSSWSTPSNMYRNWDLYQNGRSYGSINYPLWKFEDR